MKGTMGLNHTHEAVPTLFDGPEYRAVMTYNLKNGSNRLHWLIRRRKLVDVIRRASPLLLGTQEGYRYQLEYIRRKLPGYAWIGSGRFADDSDELNAIFYDTRCVSVLGSGTWWLASTPEVAGSMIEGENFPRIATWGRFSITGHDRDVVMVNTHLTYQDVGLPAQVAALIEGIDRVAQRDDDVILTGDFNRPRHSPIWRALRDAGFRDAVDIAEELEGPVFTFPNWARWPQEKADGVTEENRIDWILYRPGAGRSLPRNTVHRTINTHEGLISPSDHFPVVLSNR
jgi:endonuclease/exonuclease/phosphatase family metal-dependent hydrolase